MRWDSSRFIRWSVPTLASNACQFTMPRSLGCARYTMVALIANANRVYLNDLGAFLQLAALTSFLASSE